MSGSGPIYYRPYQESPGPSEPLSDSEAGLETGSSGYDTTDYDTGTDSDGEFAPKREFVPPDRSELYRMGGPQMKALEGSGAFAPFSGADAKPIDYGKTTFKTTSQSRQTILLVDSLNRDRTAYPQPTEMQLHLPRVYRNITSIAIQQVKLLSAFLYFRENKYNTFFKIWEEGRTLPGNGNNVLTVRIREGSYSITTLLDELNIQMNTTPTFFHFPNDFNDFASQFSVSGDLGLNFNQPGDYYYDAVLEKYVANPSFDYIITRYFVTRYINQSSYTLDELQNAYYYPVLKEALLDPVEALNIVLPASTTEDVFGRIIYGFEGLNDQYTLGVIKANTAELDRYREQRTFQNGLVNRYSWTYASYNNRINVAATGLNTSLVRTFAAQTALYTSNVLRDYGLTQTTYNNLVTANNQKGAVLNDMYNYLQTQLANNFAVNYRTYTLGQLADPNYYIFIQNGRDAEGVYTSYTPAYIEALNNSTILSFPDFNFVPSSPAVQWPNMNFNFNSPTLDWTYNGASSIINSNDGPLQNLYNFTLSNVETNQRITDSNGYINANLKYGSAEVVANISSGKYTVYAFRSPARQLLQVETLSRPYPFRYTSFNSNYGGQIPFYFNREYEFNYNSNMDTAAGIGYNTYNGLPYGFHRDEVSTLGPFSNTQTVTVLSNYNTFQLHTPVPPPSIYLPDAVGFDYDLQIELSNAVAGAQFSTNIGVYVYHDRAAYMADAVNLRTENQLNYLTSFHVSSTSTFVQTLRVLADQDYYFIVRPDATSFPNQSYKFFAYFEDATSTPRQLLSNYNIQQSGINTFSDQYGILYADTSNTVNYFFYKTYNSNYIRLPIQESLVGVSPSSQQFNYIFPAGAPVIGYDDNDISNDLTDYKGFIAGCNSFVPGTQFSVDPLNLYTFNSNSPYDPSTSQSYFYSTSQNQILASTTLTPYTATFSNGSKRDYKIVHYYDPVFIGPQELDPQGWTLNGLSTISTMQVYNLNTTGTAVTGVNYDYVYDSNLDVSTFRVGNGVYGITFLPTEGVWNMKKFCFKSAYMGVNDPNDSIEYIGIYDTNTVTQKVFGAIDLTGALAVLKRTRKVVYTPDVVASTNGFEASMGTWYEYVFDSNFPYKRQDLVDQGLPGYTPYPCTIVSGEANLYTAMPFTTSYVPTSYFMLTGSVVPNPGATPPEVVTDYLGFTAPLGESMVIPSTQIAEFGTVSNIYQSRYQLSMPIGTSGLNYATDVPIYQDEFALKDYSPFGGFVGRADFRLRTANYNEGSNHFLLFGDPSGVSTSLCDAYLVRNEGTSVRDSVYVNTFDLNNYLSLAPGEKIITWSANSYSIFAFTRVNPNRNEVKIYELSSLTTTPGGGLYQNISSLGVRDFNNGNFMNYPAYSTNITKLQVTDRKDWSYIDDIIRFNIPFQIYNYNFRGWFQYNNEPIISSFTSVYLGQTAIDNATYVNSPSAYYLTEGGILYGFNFSTMSTIFTTPYTGLETNYKTTNRYDTRLQLQEITNTGISSCVGLLVTDEYTKYVLNTQAPTRFSYLLNTSPSTATMIASAASFVSSIVDVPVGYSTDPDGGVWFSQQTGDAFAPKPITVLGNANYGDDISQGLVTTAYQIFYPTMKMVFEKQSNKYNDITNLIDINYYNSNTGTFSNYFEYPKTYAFFYNNFDNMMRDMSTISTGTTSTVVWKWGQESNFLRADTQFQGYEFNSYIYNINLSTSGPLSTPDPYYSFYGLEGNLNDYSFLVLRGYSPSEDYQCLVRFNLPNRYDYGIVTPDNLIDEISSCVSTTSLPNYNPNYVIDLLLFDYAFSTNGLYGENSLSNYGGSNISSVNYADFFAQFSTLYTGYASTGTAIAQIQSTIAANLQAYISTYFGTILPSSIYQHQRITDALPYDLLFSTSVAPQVERRDTDWGLGYNLGFARSNYEGRTVYTAPTFYKILDDYIYLQLNDQQSMNLLDTTGRETLSNTLESTGEVRKYFGKLLLNSFGSYAQSMIGTTVTFNPPLGRLDKMTFSWVDIDGNVIDNNDCEWSAVFLVNEQADITTAESTLPRLQ